MEMVDTCLTNRLGNHQCNGKAWNRVRGLPTNDKLKMPIYVNNNTKKMDISKVRIFPDM